ncbi:MAG: macrolide ABC transporter ATP-binding protein [Candidatus Magasanikbacteria bacterium RIFCSPLOWO2_01_FULL_43_20b]|uniref:Macrolide ABC transporter ATP-binding protein n=1 Tax=Candidatus Magasanikbacteria bacterium RIFCSPLOWO2_12_FULL_43_12 TaxID=1798692 RepID=A0A1F6MQN7_9BACT|nr:MAG: macrolide ABC transporter ATP-binding protein [Candidatus Magasanikbacteria bacterium RIFCSPHIGHO2_02_FULL_44_13]OGH71976.1 MAG: macrolide ABC transporter ATP-binding protein [Candidatus Magasanikbacteria bacterium RIFCSPLOWO2_02_FULL_43_22]OGH73482.1 MAG: macrolide ABC transporter ATP-binding protein [Candidatus Magasanikbacteria bacterium RIFCSPLOWO2_01_FULL_43_20b]OGH73979.1 MAG: macrolide ABC transporter ATP-binding protein [Candidatus Magasanikbacteria bacterium RIFCSPLOWO2_12_FULL_
MNTLIKTENLKKHFDNDGVITHVLNGVSFEIHQGEFVAIMGPSGSGKSTLMHILGFLDKLSDGKYFFEGQDVSQLDDDLLANKRSQKVGFVFQAFNLLPRTTVLDNVMLPLMYVKLTGAERTNRAKEAIESVGLGHRINNLSNQLSGGEKQRVAIARALINNPSVIFADEPTGNLDSKSGLQVMKILQDLNLKQGHTIILVTHEKYTAEHAERIIKIKDGLLESDEKVDNRQVTDGRDELVK